MRISCLGILALCGCVVNRPVLIEREYSAGGLSRERIVRVQSFALWPASQQIDRQRVSLGKTLSLGQSAMDQEGGGTNVVEALRALDSILGKIR